MTNTITNEVNYAGLFRRLFAIIYDCFLLGALLFIASALVTALNHGKAVEPGNAIYPFFVLLLSGLSYLYFAWFWIRGGQTLGMKTWRIQLQLDATEKNADAGIGWKLCAIRFLGAIISWCVIGMGFIWALVDKKKRCWHDLITKTVLIDLRS